MTLTNYYIVMETFRSQVITATQKRNKINRVKKYPIALLLEFLLHYITLTSYYIVIGTFRSQVITAT